MGRRPGLGRVLDKPVKKNMVRMDTGNGHGSTNTTIRRFTNITEQFGTAITVTQSAADGDSFTVNEPGSYSISVVDRRTDNNVQVGISLNSASLTTGITSLSASERLVSEGGSTNFITGASCTVDLIPRDINRHHTDGAANDTANNVQFIMTKDR